MSSFLERYKYALIFAGILIVYLCNLFIDVMDIDAAQYASISMEMAQRGDYLHVYHHGADYLDKPPLLFWLSSLSMQLFGFNNFAYKFPSLLLVLLGLYSTYKFAALYYSRKVATYAALMLASTQALFLITNDLRTDTNLLVFVIFSVWQLTLFIQRNSWWNFVLGFVGIGLAMLAKGPIGIVTIGLALGTDFMLKKEWKWIFNWRWLIGIGIVAIVLAPMTWGLYTQFDLHPEKTAYGITSPSGVKFFYWTQSFGRITGESEWDNGAGFFFFFHSILWDFQPWMLFLIGGLAVTIISVIKGGLSSQKEYITLAGFILTFLALSLSRYKLPHYIFVTFPFAAILAARFFAEIKGKWLLYVQGFFMAVFWIGGSVGMYLVFPIQSWWLLPVWGLCFLLAWYVFLRKGELTERVLFGTLITIFAFNLMLSTHFYPQLIGGYQSAGVAAKLARENGKEQGEFFWYLKHGHALDFYYHGIVPSTGPDQFASMEKGTWVLTNAEGKGAFADSLGQFKNVHRLPNFPVTGLKMQFLIPAHRHEVLDTVYIFERI
jgi:4-amino-4-deoxy-L-arabinose transferase-like glycosyltransferase